MKNVSIEILMGIDRALRSGEVDTARALLEKIAGQKVAREHAAKLASFARRSGLMGFSLNLLYPLVRPTSQKAVPASAEESAEYALALATVGATEEAIEIFGELDSERFPQISFFAAMAHLTLWNYEAAVPLLERYIPSPILDDYRRLVGKLNLASALIAMRESKESERVLTDLDTICSTGGFQLHRGNVLELLAQHSALEKKWSDARRYLDMVESDAQAFGGRDPLFVKKWRAFLPVMEHGATPENLRVLGAFRDDAARAEQWESIRQCDRLRAVTTGDRELLLHLYAGTPSHSFRRMLAADADLGEIPTHYDLVLGKPSAKPKLIECDDPILAALASDFYRPVREASLFALMFPEDCYHPTKSPARVRKAIKQFALKKLPLEIVEKDGAYRLKAKRSCRIRIVIASPFMRDRFAA